MELYILLDSATKKLIKNWKYGESITAWVAWWSSDERDKPIRCGINYYRIEGPNKVFYRGIISALENCYGMCTNDKIIICGDCEPVIKQLNGEWAVKQMRVFYQRVKELRMSYAKRGCEIEFRYMGEKTPIYKNIDQLAKRSREHIKKIINKKITF